MIAGVVGALLIAGGVYAMTRGGEERGGTDPSSSPGSGPSSPTAQPEVPLNAPTDIDTDVRPFRVTLTWAPVEASDEVQGYRVERNGNFIEEVTTSRFVDDDVLPGKAYDYTITAVGASGDTSPEATVSLRTKKLPLREARVQGMFRLVFRETSEFGYETHSLDTYEPEEFRFTPSCPQGPCGTRWKDVTYPDLVGTLVRTGASYHGSATGYWGLPGCSTDRRDTTLTIDFRVIRARADNQRNTWVATKVVGTFQSRDFGGGCQASGANGVLTGTAIT